MIENLYEEVKPSFSLLGWYEGRFHYAQHPWQSQTLKRGAAEAEPELLLYYL
jgi:hypothetical protein